MNSNIQEAQDAAAQASYLWNKVLPEGFEVIVGTADRFSPEQLLQIDTLIQEAYPNPVHQEGKHIRDFVNRVRVQIFATLFHEGTIVSTYSLALFTNRAVGMGIIDPLRDVVIDANTAATVKNFKKKGHFANLLKTSLVKAMAGIIKAIEDANTNGASLKHDQDQAVAPDLVYDQESILSKLLAGKALVRMSFKTKNKFMQMTKEVFTQCGFLPSEETKTFSQRAFSTSTLFIEDDSTDGDTIVKGQSSVYVTRVSFDDGLGIVDATEVKVFGDKTLSRTMAIFETTGNIAGKEGAAMYGADPNGLYIEQLLLEPTTLYPVIGENENHIDYTDEKDEIANKQAEGHKDENCVVSIKYSPEFVFAVTNPPVK